MSTLNVASNGHGKPCPYLMFNTSQRTCIACGRKGARGEFWRFKSKDGGAPVFDENNTAQGRGASVCKSAVCLEKALARRAFERALKLKEPLSSGFKLLLRQLNEEGGPKVNS